MSFYHKLAQTFLTLHFTGINNTAEGNNQALFGFGKPMRDVKFSREKQQKGLDVNLALHDLNREALQERFEKDDNECWETLDDCVKEVFDGVISNYEEDIAELVKQKKAPNIGNTANAVTQAYGLLNDIKKLCKKYGLWNKGYDEEDPIAIFQYNMLYYICCRKDASEPLTAEKILLTKGMLAHLADASLKPQFSNRRAEIEYAKGKINELINENKVACTDNSKKTTLPAAVPGSVIASAITSYMGLSLNISVGSSPGKLDDILLDVMKRVTELESNKHSEPKRRSVALSRQPRSARPFAGNKPKSDYRYDETNSLTIRNWLARYDAAATPAEKDDVFNGAINLLYNDDLFRNAPFALKSNKNRVMDAAMINVKTLQYASYTLKGDKDFMLDLIKHEPEAYEYASARLKKDPEFQKASMSPFVSMMFRYQHVWGAALIGLAVAAVALAVALTSTLVIPAVIGIAASSALVASTFSFFALRPDQNSVMFNAIERDNSSKNVQIHRF